FDSKIRHSNANSTPLKRHLSANSIPIKRQFNATAYIMYIFFLSITKLIDNKMVKKCQLSANSMPLMFLI
ncbi:hypothetical protein, partial [Nostoc sp. 2RC]|uniref:hypothetical protein n=1 Tax=Nostoc sp. 2RC TaxID=2485484 RepID=UPI001C8A335F